MISSRFRWTSGFASHRKWWVTGSHRKSPEVMNHYCLKHFLTLVLGDQQCFRNNSTQIGQFVKILINKTTNIYGVSWSCRSNVPPPVELDLIYRLSIGYNLWITGFLFPIPHQIQTINTVVALKTSPRNVLVKEIFENIARSYSRTQGQGFTDRTGRGLAKFWKRRTADQKNFEIREPDQMRTKKFPRPLDAPKEFFWKADRKGPPGPRTWLSVDPCTRVYHG